MKEKKAALRAIEVTKKLTEKKRKLEGIKLAKKKKEEDKKNKKEEQMKKAKELALAQVEKKADKALLEGKKVCTIITIFHLSYSFSIISWLILITTPS